MVAGRRAGRGQVIHTYSRLSPSRAIVNRNIEELINQVWGASRFGRVAVAVASDTGTPLPWAGAGSPAGPNLTLWTSDPRESEECECIEGPKAPMARAAGALQCQLVLLSPTRPDSRAR